MSLRRGSVVVMAMIALVLAAGCSLDSRFTSAAMRIDVDVYRGALSKDPHAQWGELYAAVVDAGRALTTLTAIVQNAKKKACQEGASRSALPEGSGTASGQPNNGSNSCAGVADNPTVRRLKAFEAEIGDMQVLVQRLASKLCYPGADNASRFGCLATQGESPSTGEMRRTLAEAVELAAHFQGRAFYWSESQIATPFETGSPESRGLVDLVNFYGSYGAQIGARADSFLHQLRGIDREHLPLSVHLRETAPPDTLQLYKWYGVIGKERDGDAAIRTIERLYADFNWARINTVYASGQGDVAMAFIKDEIGNWNLKSFDNDPTELLQHYTDLTKVVIKGAADVARAALAPGTTVANALLQQSLDAAGRVTSGRLGSAGAAEVANVKALRDRLLDRLAALGAEAKVTADALAADREKAATNEQAAKAAVDTANGEVAAAKTALDGGATDTRATIEASVRASAANVEARVARLVVEVGERAKTEPTLASVLTPALADAQAARQAKNEAEALLASAPEAGATAQAGKARLTITHADKLIALAEKRRDAANRQRDVAIAAAKTAAHGSDVAAKLRRLLDDQAAVLDALHLIVLPPKAEPAPSSGVVSTVAAAAGGIPAAAGLSP